MDTIHQGPMRQVVDVCRERLAGDADPEGFRLGELPEPAVEPAGRSPRHDPSSFFDDPGEGDVTLDDARAELRRGQLGLPAGGARGADVVQRTDEAARVPRRADRRAQVHEALVVVAGSLGRHRGGRKLGEAAAPGGARGVVEGMDPRQDSRDVPVDDGEPVPERDRPDRARRVSPDAGERRDLLGPLGKAPAVLAHDGARRLVQRTRPGVVAEAGPEREDVVERGRREGHRRRESRQPPLPVRQHGLETRLLRHDLADPDRVGITRPPPRQIPRVAAVVVENFRGEIVQQSTVNDPIC